MVAMPMGNTPRLSQLAVMSHLSGQRRLRRQLDTLPFTLCSICFYAIGTFTCPDGWDRFKQLDL